VYQQGGLWEKRSFVWDCGRVCRFVAIETAIGLAEADGCCYDPRQRCAMVYDLTEQDVECLGQLLNKAVVQAHPTILKRESDLLVKLLKQREESITKEKGPQQ